MAFKRFFSDIYIELNGLIKLFDAESKQAVILKAPSSMSSDVEFTFPSDSGSNGQVLSTDGDGNLAWQSPMSPGEINLDDLEDVDAAAPNDADVLTWVDANDAWESQPIPTPDLALDELNDVDVPTPNDGDVLTWVDANSAWESVAPAASGANTNLSNLDSPTAINQTLLPDSDLGRDIGDPTNRFSTIYCEDVTSGDTSLLVDSGFQTGGGNSASVNVFSGNVEDGTSGLMQVNSGNATGTGSSGNLSLLSGFSITGSSGVVEIASGDVGGSSDSGIATFKSGRNLGTGDSGNLTLKSGDTVDGDSGDVELSAGEAGGSGVRGSVNVIGNYLHLKARVAIDSAGLATLTADNTVLTLGNRSYIWLDSDSAVAADRTFILQQGLIAGQIVILEWLGTNAGELSTSVDGGGNVRLAGGAWLPTQYDTIMLIWNNTDWTEICRSVNV